MADSHTRTDEIKGDTDAGRLTISLKYDIGAKAKAQTILQKAEQFKSWAQQSDQTSLDLSSQVQVVLKKAMLRVEKPHKQRVHNSIGLDVEHVSYEDQSTLFALMEAGHNLQIIVRDLTPPKKAETKEAQ